MAGVTVSLGPRVVVDPSFGVGLAAWRAKLPTPSEVRLGVSSTLLLLGELRGLRIESLELQGTLVLRLCDGCNVTLRRVRVANAGWSFRSTDGASDEALAIRGYAPVRTEQRELTFDTPGAYVVDDEEGECEAAA